MKTINFSESFFRWFLKEQKTHGRFTIEAALRIFSATGEMQKEYFLLAGVMASNVFHSDNFIIKPVYFYQPAFSMDDHKLMRTYITQSKIMDTFGSNSNMFKETDFHIVKSEAKVICDNSSVISHTLSYHKLNCISRFNQNEKYIYEIEYPVKHINLNDFQFQVETGPVLLPGLKNPENFQEMEIAYLTFRDFKSGELARYAQAPINNVEFNRGYLNIDKRDIQTKFLTY